MFIIGQYFLTIYFIGFDFILISDLDSDFNSFIEILSASGFLVDFLINWLDVSKYFIDSFKDTSLSRSVPVNSQWLSFCNAFHLFIS